MCENHIGRLILSSRNTYKIAGKPAKQCIILSEKMEDILISTNKEFNVKDYYVLVDTKRKQLIDNYGIIGNTNDDLNIFHYLYTYFWLSNSKLYKSLKEFDFNFDIVKERELYMNEVLTIDPTGSIDLDDGFSIIFSENIINLDIHISDPMSYFDLTKDYTWIILKELLNRLSTCYIPLNGKIRHLLPEINIDNVNNKNVLDFATLIGENKRAISFCFTINLETEDIQFEIKKTLLTKINNTTYDLYDECINKNIEYKKKLSHLCKFLIKKMNANIEFIDKTNISHSLIEVFMVWINYYTGNYLYSTKNKMFVRTQEKFISTITDIPEYAKIFLNFGAKYELVTEKTDKEFLHYSLGITNYCHISSPMRRFIDMFNHLLLHDVDNDIIMFNKLCNIIDVEKINTVLKKYKKLSYGYNILNHLSINNIFKACILDILDNNKILLVLYDEKYNFTQIIKTQLPINYEKINIFDELIVQVFYDSYKLKSTSLPFSIKIL
jgi:hypothetical protein